MELKICIFQFDIRWLNATGNLALIKTKLESIENDVDLIVLPEMFLSGFCMDASLTALNEADEEIKELIKLAEEFEVAIIGSLAIEEEGKYYNRALLISNEGIIGRYDKQYLYSPSGENDVFSAKYETCLMQFKGWNILPQVCYDLRFPENVRKLEAPDLLIYMANWPEPRIHHWDVLLKGRAIENLCFTIGCNRMGTDGNNWHFPGHSVIVKPDGSHVKTEEHLNLDVFKISLAEVREHRSKYKFLDDKKV